MKIHLLIILFILLFPVSIFGQVGNTQSNPIVVGTFGGGFNYSNSQNTADFTNNYTVRTPNDVYYRFTLSKKMEVIMRLCGSTVPDTYLTLLDASGRQVAYNDDYYGDDGCGTKSQAYLKKELDAGTYYVVSEGYSQNGVILTSISGTGGDTRADPIVIGTFDKSFKYSNKQNTANYTNQYIERAPNDVFYKFILTRKMSVTMNHYGSELSDTYMILLDAAGTKVAYNDDYSGEGSNPELYRSSFIQTTLGAGTYYIVSEGYNSSGIIVTNIIANASEEFNYPDVPGTYSSEPEAVGGIGGAFSVSATGGATYSIPIKVPQGVGGLQPSLAITYNSQGGHGMIGWGCSLSGLSAITRGTKNIYHDGTAKGLTFASNEAYYLDGKRLVYSSGTAEQEGAVYYPESDPFTKVIVHGNYSSTTSNIWFEVQASNGLVSYYGNTDTSRQRYTANGAQRIYAWYLGYVEDPLSNTMTYTYNNWSNYMYPATIVYGGNKNSATGLQNTITFSYDSRPDSQPFVIEGQNGYMSQRLGSITGTTGYSTFRSYSLQYDTGSDAGWAKFSRLTTVTEKNGAGESLQPIKLNWTYLPAHYQSCYNTQINAASTYPGVSFYDQQFIAGDFNGDGLTDIMGIAPVKIPTGPNSWINDTYAYIYQASLNSYGDVQFLTGKNYQIGASFEIADWKNYRAGSSVIDFDGDGINEFVVPYVDINNHWKQVGFYVYGNTIRGAFGYNLKCSSEMPAYGTGDFNHDGKGDIVFLEKGQSGGRYPGEVIGFNSGTSLYRTAFNLTLPSKPEKMFASDFNGDGLEDMLVLYEGGYTIYWNQGNGITGVTFADSSKTTGTNLADVWMIRSGDFNGDGFMDFIMNSTGDNKWYFALNNGNGTFVKVQACTLDIYDQNFTGKDDARFDCNVYDFDFDGKSDVLITKAMYTKKSAIFQGSWGEFNKAYTYWMRSTGTTLAHVQSATSNREEDANSLRYVVGDFNGDGQAELMNFGYNCASSANANVDPSWKLYRNIGYNASSGKVTSITGDFGGTTSISYATLANGGIYTRGSGATYPMADYTIPLNVVKSVSSNNGTAGSMTVDYQYSGLKMHQQGKGFLGMTSTTVSNSTLGTVAESGVKSWNTTFYVPSAIYSKSTIDGKIAESNVAMTVVDKGSKKFFTYPSTTTEKDLDGNSITTTCQFNTTYGYMTEEKVDFGNNMYKTVQYGDYMLAGKAYKPQLITRIQKHTDDASLFTLKTKITYNASKGWQTQTIGNYGSSLPLTTDFTYDDWGNVLTTKTSGSGIISLIENYGYDATKRFVAKKSTTPASTVSTFTYDTWGNVKTETDETDSANKLTITHSYDNWGNKTASLLPDGRKTSYQTGWNSNTSKRYFTLTQGTGEPWVKTWYDNQNREVLVETIGAKGMNIRRTTLYNSKGQVTQKQVQTGDLTTTENFTYDGRGRILTQMNSAGQNVSYSYGNRTISSTLDGKTTTKTYDGWSGVKSVTDPASSIAYTYFSLGKPQKMVTGGATFAMSYYDTGAQKTLSDPNAGTITYTYDAASRLTKQVDGKGKIITNNYDVYSRLATSVIGDITTAYTYGTTMGNDYLRLTKQQTGSNSIAFTYDKYGRTITEKRQVDGGGTLDFGYTYNAQGQLSQVIYPGSLTVNRSYDAYGNLQQILAGTQAIWELAGNTGTVFTAKLGGALTGTDIRNSQGLLTNLKTLKGTTVLHNMDYVFNGATGNLTSRTGMIAQAESFVYDNVDRLKTVQQGGSTVMSMDYHANGNILSKTGIGAYSYGKPHAVSAVDNTGALIAGGNQAIAYTAFNKASSISETVGADNYILDIIYGPDQQRWKSTLKKNNVITRNIIFAEDYESITEGGLTKQLYYLSGSNGLAAIYVKQSGQTDKIYYVCKDHLGSVVKLVDVNGAEVFKASYDAWGRRTVANSTFKFHRGYTGHEHLDEFKLINMNGRMYDPILGRFLSPDPFVQAPDFSQSFNRYSYCLNNPFKYTDPNGELPWLVPVVIGAVVGTYSGGIMANEGEYNPLKWDYNSGKTWGYMLGGAVVGGVSGYAGWAIAGSGIPMANTLGIAGSSLLNSVGTWAYTGGETPISMSLGAVSYDFTNNEWGYLGKKGNKWYENLGYTLGGLANLSDILMGLNPQSVDLVTEHSDEVGHSALVKDGTNTGVSGQSDPNSLISVGPDRVNDPSGSWHWMRGTNRWSSYSADNSSHPRWTQNLKVNMKTIERYAKYLNGLEAKGGLTYSIEFSSCVTHTSRALNLSGIFNIGIHPYLLNAQMYLWNNGLKPWTYSYFLNQ